MDAGAVAEIVNAELAAEFAEQLAVELAESTTSIDEACTYAQKAIDTGSAAIAAATPSPLPSPSMAGSAGSVIGSAPP